MTEAALKAYAHVIGMPTLDATTADVFLSRARYAECVLGPLFEDEERRPLVVRNVDVVGVEFALHDVTKQTMTQFAASIFLKWRKLQ